MGVEQYVFAMFIAALVCVVAIVFKILFSNVKKQTKLLNKFYDERDAKLNEAYNKVETIMEEFQDQAKMTIDELSLREQEYRAAMKNMAAFQLPPELMRKEHVIERVPRTGSMPVDTNRIRLAGEVIERAERYINHDPLPVNSDAVLPMSADPGLLAQAQKTEASPVTFQKFFDDAAEAPPPTPYSPAPLGGGSRRDSILSLANAGKTDVEIASQLGITRNEVQLVIGLTRT